MERQVLLEVAQKGLKADRRPTQMQTPTPTATQTELTTMSSPHGTSANLLGAATKTQQITPMANPLTMVLRKRTHQ